MHTDGRTDRQSSFHSSSAVEHLRLKSFDWIGQFVNAQPTAVSTAIAKCSNAFPQLLALDAGRLARSQNPEGPATGHLDPSFLSFPGS